MFLGFCANKATNDQQVTTYLYVVYVCAYLIGVNLRLKLQIIEE